MFSVNIFTFDIARTKVIFFPLSKFMKPLHTFIYLFNISIIKDEALREIDEKEEMQTQSTSEEDEDTDDEFAEQRRLQEALFEKEKVFTLVLL